MAEPNYAFNPSVASWVHAMSLAGSPDPQLDPDPPHDHLDGLDHLDRVGTRDALDSIVSIDSLDPDDYYKAASPPTDTSAAPRSRPPTAGTTASTAAHTSRAPFRSTPRSVSGPASPTPSARSPPPVSNKVKALAERFERSPGGSSVPSAVRSRSREPTRSSTYSNHSTHSVPSMPSAPNVTSAPSVPGTQDSPVAAAQPPKGVAYGSYKFTNLKPRDRPQPAPAPPSAPTSVSAASPRSTRRTTGSRSSIDHQLSPSNKSVASSHRRPGSGGRPLFFGEILSEQDATMPGYMIPTMASTARDVQSPASDPIMEEPQEPPADEPLLSSATFSSPARNGHSARSIPQPILQPPSRIPIVARRSRRSSIGSDSGSSAHSIKYTPTTKNYNNKTSPTRVNRRPVGGSTPTEYSAPSQPTLPALAYRSHRERGKSPNRVASGPSVPAVVAAPPPPASPRLRNSRERQPLQPSPGTFAKSPEPHSESGYFSPRDRHTSQHESPMAQPEQYHGEIESRTLDFAFSESETESQTLNFAFPQNQAESQTLNFAFPQSEQPTNVNDSAPSVGEHTSSAHHHSLSLETLNLGPLPPFQASSAATDFEESPVLGMPGSFISTPAAAPEEPAPELLQPAVFQTPKKKQSFDFPDFDKSVLGVRESIPIMFNTEKQREQRQSPSEQWQPTSEYTRQSLQTLSPHRSNQTLASVDRNSALRPDGKNSPTDSFYNRDSLQDNDQAHLSIGPLNFDNGTYSVINSVLNLYHQAPVITSDLATFSRNRVYQVSPVIAQHKDWGSKEATETYLARLLSDANASSHRNTKVNNEEAMLLPQLSFGSFHSRENLPESPVGGTAIIFPPQSRRYSRSSRGSTTTTIQEDASRSGSSCANRSQDKLCSYSTDNTSASTTGIDLPQLAWTNEGLGLSLQNGSTHQNLLNMHSPPNLPPPMHSPHHPPPPIHSPPPPPIQTSPIPLPPIQTPNEEQEISTPNFAYAFPEQPQRSPQHQFDGQFEQHPARARTPVSKDYERHQDDRSSTSTQAEIGDKSLPEGDSFGEEEPVSAENSQSDPAKQALVKRYRILEEMLTTEHQFCIDMMIAHNIFEATAGNIMTEKEKRALFSNCKDLEKFSLSLFRAFKKAAKPVVNYDIPPPTGPWSRDSVDSRVYNPLDASNTIRNTPEDIQQQFETCTLENDHLTTIGRVFLDNVEKMERLYTSYYLNSQNASAYMKKNQNNPELTGWVSACFEQVENMTQAWDLDSLLVKPGQRLLKYPLLLESLEQASDPSHPDLENIQAARQEILAISGRINEAKKRADTFRAATTEGKKEKKGGKGIGNAFVKAFIPKADKTKAYDEADKIFKDQEYKSREQKFGGHFFQLQIVIRDFENYLDSITEHYNQLNIVFLGFITVCEVAPSVNPEIESTWRKWAMAHFELQNKALEEHKAAVRTRVLRPIGDLWEMWVSYQKTIEQRKKFLLHYVKHKQAIDRGEKPDPEMVASAEKFTTINDTLKHELPLLYEKTKSVMRNLMTLFMALQKEWYKTCSKKILPLLESEPQHTTSIRYDLESYVERFNADYRLQQETANRLGIVNQTLLQHISSMTSPIPTVASDGGGSARNSSSRRTESMGSEASVMDARKRHSGGYGSRSQMRSMDGPPRSSPAGPAYPPVFQTGANAGRPGLGPTSLREARALSPTSDASEITLTRGERSNSTRSRAHSYKGFDGTFETDDRSLAGSSIFDFPPQLGASFLSPTQSSMQTISSPSSQPASRPGSTRQSGVFNSALPMSESPVRGSVEDLPATSGETEEPEVLFLAASLFEFNIAHDRREGGIPYLVYVPGEIFDVIGMKGELWLARNQDDSTKTVGWIWEKHFARILPEDA